MATSEFWQRMSSSTAFPEWGPRIKGGTVRRLRGTVRFWMAVDALTVVGAATIATLHEFHVRHARTILGMRSLTAIHGRSAWIDRKSTRLNSSHLGISYAVF